MVEAGHGTLLIAPGSGSGFDIGPAKTIKITEAIARRLQDKKNVQLWASCVAGLDQCQEVADSVRDLPNVKGMLVLHNKHSHSDGQGWLDFFIALGRRIRMHYMVYRIAEARSEALMTLQHYLELAEADPLFVELKWATDNDTDLLKQVVAALMGKVHVVCGLGDLNGTQWMELLGVGGWTAYAGNVCPYLLKEIETAALASDFGKAYELSKTLRAFEQLRFGKYYIKYNNRLVIAATHPAGRNAYLRPPNAKFTDNDWAEATILIAALKKEELAARKRAGK
jgi:dihydrodipicolinate synthase/N-acetylneuraminate lyase